MTATEFDEAFPDAEFDFWDSHPDYPVEDWQWEVSNDDTRLGYWGWVKSQMDQDAESGND